MFHRCLSLVVAISALPFTAAAQTPQPCDPPAPPIVARTRNIFDAEREIDLGDAIAEHIQKDFRIIDDPAVTGHLTRMGERLARHLPPTGLHYRFFLMDIPDANAYSMPGGRVYVSRKLVALAQSDAELAGVIAHELGHAVARHSAETMTRQLREILGVSEVKDRKDVFEKYHQLIENVARNPKALRAEDRHGEEDQLVADRIGVFATAKAGYDPEAGARFFDRIADTKGKTGGFFSDMFGKTSPNSRRLREMIKAVAALPDGCADTVAAASDDEFKRWQTAVLAYSGGVQSEALHAVRTKTVLEPPLRGEVRHLRFSHDGRYVLAQDDAGITVLTREPFAIAFRIDAPEAHEAQFTPDSAALVFWTPELRVERWSLAEKKLASAKELFIRSAPLQSLLSPDASVLAVYDAEFDLTLYDVESGAAIFEKREFHLPDPFKVLFLRLITAALEERDLDDLEVDWVNMGFSPDARLFAAGGRGLRVTALGVGNATNAIAYDVRQKSQVQLKGDLKKYIAGGFAFLGPDKIVAAHPEERAKSGVVAFPSGELSRPLDLTPAGFSPATAGDYLLIRPISGYPVGVMDVGANKVFKASKEPALDVYRDVFVAERRNGELGLFGVEKNDLKVSLALPRNPLGRLRAVTVSPDFKWLAASERSRGGVWNLETGERVFHVRGFRGAHFADGILYADFPEQGDQARMIARLDLAKKAADSGPKLEEHGMRQIDQYVVHTKPNKKDESLRENVTLEVRDSRTLSLLWSKQFAKEAPSVWLAPSSGTVVAAWPVASKHAKGEIKADPKLSQRLTAMREKDGDYFIQVFDAREGRPLGSLLIETGKGSFRADRIMAAGDFVVVADTQNRVLVYSLATGAQVGRVFGDRVALSPSGSLMAVENERGRLTVYDTASVAERDSFTFTHAVAMLRFRADGRTLFVLTQNQEAFVLEMQGN